MRCHRRGDKREYSGQLSWQGRFTTRKKVKGTLRFASRRTPKNTREGQVPEEALLAPGVGMRAP